MSGMSDEPENDCLIWLLISPEGTRKDLPIEWIFNQSLEVYKGIKREKRDRVFQVKEMGMFKGTQ